MTTPDEALRNQFGELERRLADLQAREEQLRYLVFVLVEEIKPGHRFASLALALGSSLTASELDCIRAFFGWAEANADTLTAEEIRREFARRLPRQKHHIEGMWEAHNADGTYPALARITLDDARGTLDERDDG